MRLGQTSIRLKLLISSALLLLIIFSGLTLYLVRVNTQALRANLQREANSFAALATGPIGDSYSLYADSGTDQIAQTIRNYLSFNKDITNVTIFDTTGTKLYSLHDSTAPTLTTAQATTFTAVALINHGALSTQIYPYFSTSGAHPFTIAYNVSNAQINSAVRHEVWSLVIAGATLLVLTTALTYVLLNRIIINPIREVSRQAGVISGGNLEQQIVVRGHDEVAALGTAVNTMAESLKDSIVQLQQIDKVKNEFMAITSHNLRTPLTIINGYLESMDSFTTVAKLQQAIRRIGDSVKRLDGFAEDVLTISSIELGNDMRREPLELAPFMQQIADETRTAAQLQDISLQTDISANAHVLCNKPYLRSAIWNLIDNAIKFTPKDGTISLKLASSKPEEVQIIVSDTGIGIEPSEMPKLFTKFHRATSVTRYDYEGTGIGLYATKIIVEQQGGSIGVTSTLGSGSSFTITLPIATSASAMHNKAVST